MKIEQWKNFLKAREKFRVYIEEMSRSLPELRSILQKFADSRSDGKNSSYTVETPVVYNTALDDITADDEIKLIVVADNPGRREQAAENRRYLIGPSGKIAQKFFRDNPALGIDFNKNVIILNKTPIHSPRTNELRQLARPKILSALNESQKTMASLLLEFQKALLTPVWITGYSEMKKNGLFETYTDTIKKIYANEAELYKKLFIYRHFSMNQFTIDLKKQSQSGEKVSETLYRIGNAYRERILVTSD